MIKARLVIYSSRKYPLKSGYRPLFLINDSYYSGSIFFEDADISQNEIRDVKIDFPTFKGQLNKGEKLKIFGSPNHEIGEILVI